MAYIDEHEIVRHGRIVLERLTCHCARRVQLIDDLWQ
jgi:hypothetical protein